MKKQLKKLEKIYAMPFAIITQKYAKINVYTEMEIVNMR